MFNGMFARAFWVVSLKRFDKPTKNTQKEKGGQWVGEQPAELGVTLLAYALKGVQSHLGIQCIVMA